LVVGHIVLISFGRGGALEDFIKVALVAVANIVVVLLFLFIGVQSDFLGMELAEVHWRLEEHVLMLDISLFNQCSVLLDLKKRFMIQF
jgi:hypothetical protein